ncbi:MAG: hypothetical protein AAFO95_15690 [Cyanobacteria bacterium J06600_6]
MVKRKRVSLSIRLQPYPETLLAELVNWLNSLEQSEKKQRIETALIMAYLPYARESSGASKAEIERCCWETQDMLNKHGYYLRRILDVSEVPTLEVPLNQNEHSIMLSFSSPEAANNKKKSRTKSPSKTKDKNIHRYIDGIFGD